MSNLEREISSMFSHVGAINAALARIQQQLLAARRNTYKNNMRGNVIYKKPWWKKNERPYNRPYENERDAAGPGKDRLSPVPSSSQPTVTDQLNDRKPPETSAADVEWDAEFAMLLDNWKINRKYFKKFVELC